MAQNVRTIHFNSLPDATRHRLIAAMTGAGRPAAILSEKAASTGAAVAGWTTLALLGAFGVFMLGVAGYGRPYRGMVQGPEYLVGYLLAMFTIAYSVIAIVRKIRLAKSLPFPSGRYLFPTDYVEANGPQLTLISTAHLRDYRGVHHHYNGGYTHTALTFTFDGAGVRLFSVNGKHIAERVFSDVQNSQYALAEAARQRDMQRLQELDVFFEARMSGQWDQLPAEMPAGMTLPASHVPFAGSVPAIVQRAAIAALVLGAVLAAPAWLVRNYLSDEEAFDRLDEYADRYSAQAYIRNNGRHTAEVQNEVLPAAEFREATRRNTVAALRDFVRQYPRSRWVAQAVASIHQRYAIVQANFAQQASTDDPRMFPFMQRMLAYLEATGSPTVDVRYRTPSAESLRQADVNIRTRGTTAGLTNVAPIGDRFDPHTAQPREEAITQFLQRGFSAVFPGDVMSLHQGVRLSEGSEPIALPTIEVAYQVDPSGEIYTLERSRRSFVGISIDFVVTMRIPNDPNTFSFNLHVEPPQNFTVHYTRYTNGPGDTGLGHPADSTVYDQMTDRAFDQLQTRMRSVFFRAGSAGYGSATAGGGGTGYGTGTGTGYGTGRGYGTAGRTY